MDYCCNKKIPENTDDIFIYRPISKTWINGLANTYEANYYPELDQFVDKLQVKNCINRINDDLYQFWPCPTCFAVGYCCVLCTLGLSFLCPYICISDAKKHLLENIERMNKNIFSPRGLELSYQQLCCTSFLQIKIVDNGKKGYNNQLIQNTNKNIKDNNTNFNGIGNNNENKEVLEFKTANNQYVSNNQLN